MTCLQKKEIALEILNYRKNGEKFWNLLSLMPVKDAYGNVVSFIGVQSDISELIRRKHAERELQQAKVGAIACNFLVHVCLLLYMQQHAPPSSYWLLMSYGSSGARSYVPT